VREEEEDVAFGASVERGYPRRLGWPTRPAALELFGPYHRYQGFCAHEPPVPGVAVIMHCSNETKPQLRPPRPEYTAHQGR
jgi:hypothetical protein